MNYYRKSFQKRLVKFAMRNGYTEQRAKKLVKKFDDEAKANFKKALRKFNETMVKDE